MNQNALKVILVIIGVAFAITMFAVLFAGCSKDDTTQPVNNTPAVNMKVSFTKGGVAGFSKSTGVDAVDSLRVDSAVVVFSRIKFESHVDTVVVDTTEGAPDDDHNMNVTFKGPFVVHMRDTIAISFASQALPAGTYDGIKFKIHRLHNGEQHEDSDDRNHHPRMSDSPLFGSSIIVWGSVKKNGVWTSFTYSFNGEVEFKIKGNFVVAASTDAVNIALNFNIGSWFFNSSTNVLLDPTDLTDVNRALIRHAIYTSFGKGKGGHDRGDGHPND